MRVLFVIGFILCAWGTSGQPIRLSPVFPYVNDTISVFYNANQGNAVLQGTSPVFIHTGLLTPNSQTINNWQNVQGIWGTADTNVLMTPLGANRHKITYSINSFYGISSNTTVNHLAFVFRNTNGSLVGRNADGSDILYPVYNPASALEASWDIPERTVEALPNTSLTLKAEATRVCTLRVFLNNVLLQQTTGSRKSNVAITTPSQMGIYKLCIEAIDGTDIAHDTIILVVNNALNVNSVIQVVPAIPTLNDTVTLVYDVLKGNQALEGVSPVFLHTGLLTQSGGISWQNVQGVWGTTDSNTLMTSEIMGVWSKRFHVSSFYGVPISSVGVQKMAMVFRNHDGTLVGRTDVGTDIEYSLLQGLSNGFTAGFVNVPVGPFTVGDSVSIQAASSANSTMKLWWNNTILNQVNSSVNLNFTWKLGPNSSGQQTIILEAQRLGITVYDTLNFTVAPAQAVGGRILEVTPAFPTATDSVTVIYNASEGNAALLGVAPVFAHTGLITTSSTSASNWQFVQGTWGVADPKVQMAPLVTNKHLISYSIPSFYGTTSTTPTLQKLAFVFRDSTGTKVGRDLGGQDIFYPISINSTNFQARFFVPSNVHVIQQGQCLSLLAQSNLASDVAFYDNGVLIASDSGVTSLAYCQVPAGSPGNHLVEMVATRNGVILRDTVFYVFSDGGITMDPPTGLKNGATIQNDSTLVLKLYAPGKQHVFVLTEANGFKPNSMYQMRRSFDGNTYWISLRITPNQDFVYQYLVDGSLRIADPFSELVLDPANDPSIPLTSYPNPYIYPGNKTFGHISLLRLGIPEYAWNNVNFQAPPKENLMIYELLVRDFSAQRNYTFIKDSVSYLAKLGVNAVQFMPVNEFENNESWGYNPSYHMALDKFYGTPNAFKELIDTLHGRGIAVILDVVLNHAEGQSPLAQLWWDPVQNRPASNSPYFNIQCPHPPNCWGNDFNHESPAVQQFVDQVLKYWIEEYRVDGFRFDMSKGFTNGSGGGWDVGRQNLLKRIADGVRSYKPNAYLILEHWADNSEEIVLSNYGMMLWGNVCHEYQDATMGFSSATNFSPAYHGNRGWTQPGLITYLESHDEERVAFKNQVFGNNALSSYNVRTLPVSMQRMELTTLFGHLIPGPKMMWQFQELGYDVSINNPCRVCVKPVRWNYYQVVPRRRLYETTSIINHLKQNYPVFGTSSNFYSDLYGHVKQMGFIHSSMSAVVVGNFDVATQSKTVNFPHTGTWYEYFSGQSVSVSANQTPMTLGAGEYRLFTDQIIPRSVVTFGNDDLISSTEIEAYPNPTTGEVYISGIKGSARIILHSSFGELISTVEFMNSGKIDIGNLPTGLYVVKVVQEEQVERTFKIVKQ